MNEPIIISTTFETRDDAENLARFLLEKRLIACAQISAPCQSLYWWQGQITKAAEILLTMKTDRSLYAKIEKIIKMKHPYIIPEIVVTAIVGISEEYLNWLNGELLA